MSGLLEKERGIQLFRLLRDSKVINFVIGKSMAGKTTLMRQLSVFQKSLVNKENLSAFSEFIIIDFDDKIEEYFNLTPDSSVEDRDSAFKVYFDVNKIDIVIEILQPYVDNALKLVRKDAEKEITSTDPPIRLIIAGAFSPEVLEAYIYKTTGVIRITQEQYNTVIFGGTRDMRSVRDRYSSSNEKLLKLYDGTTIEDAMSSFLLKTEGSEDVDFIVPYGMSGSLHRGDAWKNDADRYSYVDATLTTGDDIIYFVRPNEKYDGESKALTWRIVNQWSKPRPFMFAIFVLNPDVSVYAQRVLTRIIKQAMTPTGAISPNLRRWVYDPVNGGRSTDTPDGNVLTYEFVHQRTEGFIESFPKSSIDFYRGQLTGGGDSLISLWANSFALNARTKVVERVELLRSMLLINHVDLHVLTSYISLASVDDHLRKQGIRFLMTPPMIIGDKFSEKGAITMLQYDESKFTFLNSVAGHPPMAIILLIPDGMTKSLVEYAEEEQNRDKSYYITYSMKKSPESLFFYTFTTVGVEVYEQNAENARRVSELV